MTSKAIRKRIKGKEVIVLPKNKPAEIRTDEERFYHKKMIKEIEENASFIVPIIKRHCNFEKKTWGYIRVCIVFIGLLIYVVGFGTWYLTYF
jgi:hypothetical protein